MDLSITAANLLPDSTGYESLGTRIVGEAVTPGQPAYVDSSNVAWKGDANASAGSKAGIIGVFMATGATGQPVEIGKGRIAFGSILTTAEIYLLSDTAGGIKPKADQASGDYLTEIGVAMSATVMNVQPKPWGVAKA